MNQKIAKRIPELKTEFVEEQKKKINKFVQKHTNRELKPDEMKKIKEQTWQVFYFDTNPKIMTQTKNHNDLGRILAIIINH